MVMADSKVGARAWDSTLYLIYPAEYATCAPIINWAPRRGCAIYRGTFGVQTTTMITSFLSTNSPYEGQASGESIGLFQVNSTTKTNPMRGN